MCNNCCRHPFRLEQFFYGLHKVRWNCVDVQWVSAFFFICLFWSIYINRICIWPEHIMVGKNMSVSKNTGNPQMDGLYWKTLLKWMIWEWYTIFGNIHTYFCNDLFSNIETNPTLIGNERPRWSAGHAASKTFMRGWWCRRCKLAWQQQKPWF